MAQAAHWYGRASALGNAKAARNLGNLYLEGSGVTRDLIRAAAAKGHADGQIFLNRMLVEGEGIEQDIAEAWFWFTPAEAQEPRIASYYFGKYSGAVDTTHKEAARVRAKLWVPKS